MSKPSSYIATFILMLGCHLALAQGSPKSSPFYQLRLELATFVPGVGLSSKTTSVLPYSSPTLSQPKSSFASRPLYHDSRLVENYGCYSYDDLAVFCKIEYKLEKAFKIPIKIRLGEVHYTEKMEGKKGYAP